MTARALLAVTAALMVASACGEAKQSASGPTGGTVTVTLTEAGCQYEGPAQMRAGEVLVQVRNQTKDRVWVGLSPIASGHTYGEFAVYLDQARERQLQKQPNLGPPEWAFPTSTMDQPQAGPVDLHWRVSPGTYAFGCGRHATDATGADTELGIWAAGPFVVGS